MQKGGVFMIPIVALSIFVTAVILFKGYQFWRLQLLNTQFVDQFFGYLYQGNLKSAMPLVNASPNPIARVIESAVSCIFGSNLPLERSRDEIRRVAHFQIRQLETYMKGLEMSSNISPLLGLLGTVQGMVMAFATLEHASTRIDPSLLAGGIWTALITTVAGLMVAIPSLAAHYWFESRIDKTQAIMQDTVIRIINLHSQMQNPGSQTAYAQQAAPQAAGAQAGFTQQAFQGVF
ncbi:MAG: MotA/TolQ/ExbB proton channel family protein [Proteobacteria bacterium]|nr:MotA/TolQ/ExbB proton channel family protein [Pseudomonadota bacterium]